MLITLCYLYLWARWGARPAGLIRRTVRRLYRTRCSFTFCGCGGAASTPARPRRQRRQGPAEERVCLRIGTNVFFTGEAQSLDDLNKWSLLLITPFMYADKIVEAEQIAFVTESISAQTDNLQSISSSSKKIVKWSDCCSPLAYKSGETYKLIAKASVDNFSNLGIAFMEDRLQMDNGMVPNKIVSVHLQESALKKLEQVTSAVEEKKSANGTEMEELTPAIPLESTAEYESDVADPPGGGGEGMQAERSKLERGHESQDECNNLADKEIGPGEHHHLHLSSCYECLQLESSTIESVRFASAENIPELPDDCSGSLEEVTDDFLARDIKRINLSGKPPNILVYMGSDYMKTKFEQIESILKECIDPDNYVIYPLLEKQILKVPWLDNSLLLVIATEEPISEDNHKQFLTFLSKGGKILGLSTSFTFGSIKVKSKNELNKTIHELVVFKADNTEVKLNLLTSGSVFEEDVQEDIKKARPLSRLNNPDKDIVIIHLTYGDIRGEAILCQVHLELDISSVALQTQQDFNSLKMSNAKRYEVLKEILTLLGLSCELSEVPSLTPIYLFSHEKEIHASFLKWLHQNVDAEGLIKSSKMSLKFMPFYKPEMEITPCRVPVITELGDFLSEHFSVETYRHNLQTKKLGKIVLFAEVTSTTMNLLDGSICLIHD